MNSFKQKKMDAMLADSKHDGDLHEQHTWSVPWPIRYPMTDAGKRLYLIPSPEFTLCDHKWSLTLYPSGMDGESEFLMLNLVSVSEMEVFAHYSLQVVNHLEGGENCKWEDPEPIVAFSSMEDGDNTWGTDELIMMSEIEENESMYVKNNEITFLVDVAVFGREGMQTHAIAKAISESVRTDALIKMADDDINSIVTALPKGKNLNTQKKQEDGILSNRVSAGGAAAPGRRRDNNAYSSSSSSSSRGISRGSSGGTL